MIGVIRLMKFFVAPFEGDARLHDRVEGAIGRYYKAHPEPALRDFFCPGLKVPALIPYERSLRLMVSSDVPLAGMKPEILD